MKLPTFFDCQDKPRCYFVILNINTLCICVRSARQKRTKEKTMAGYSEGTIQAIEFADLRPSRLVSLLLCKLVELLIENFGLTSP